MSAEVMHTTRVQKGPSLTTSAFTARTRITPIGEELELNAKYFGTIPGILKLIQVVVAVICMICISPPLTWFSRLLTFLVSQSFALTILLIFASLVTLRNVVLPNFNWTLTELIWTFLTALSYFIFSITHLSLTNRNDYEFPITFYGFYAGYIAAGVFGLLNSLAYAVGTYFLYLEWNNSRRANSVSPADH